MLAVGNGGLANVSLEKVWTDDASSPESKSNSDFLLYVFDVVAHLRLFFFFVHVPIYQKYWIIIEWKPRNMLLNVLHL